MRTLQLYVTGAATGSAIAQVTIPSAGTIRGVQVMMVADCTADNSQARLELSKVPATQIQTNGAVDPFLEVGVWKNVGAAGNDLGGVNTFFPLDVPVRQGEIIYVHANVTTCTYIANFIIYYA